MQPSWVPMYLPDIRVCSAEFDISINRIIAVIWQESNGGIDPKTGLWSLNQLYRFEPAFWDKYLAKRPDFQPPTGVPLEAWKRRVSASYGLCQVMYSTGVQFGLLGAPEQLLAPRWGILYGCKVLANCRKATGNWDAAHLKYNGGGRPAYVNEVNAKLAQLV